MKAAAPCKQKLSEKKLIDWNFIYLKPLQLFLLWCNESRSVHLSVVYQIRIWFWNPLQKVLQLRLFRQLNRGSTESVKASRILLSASYWEDFWLQESAFPCARLGFWHQRGSGFHQRFLFWQIQNPFYKKSKIFKLRKLYWNVILVRWVT